MSPRTPAVSDRQTELYRRVRLYLETSVESADVEAAVHDLDELVKQVKKDVVRLVCDRLTGGVV